MQKVRHGKVSTSISKVAAVWGDGTEHFFWLGGCEKEAGWVDYPDNYGSRWTAFPLGWGRMRTAKGPDDFGIGFMGSWGIF